MVDRSFNARWASPGNVSPAGWLIAGITLLAFAIRLSTFDQGLFADELSTAWVVLDHSLGHVLSTVRSNDEITPPLYFVLAWGSSKLGSNPDLIRLPSLVAGVATVPIVYLLGARTVGRRAGLLAAAIVTLSPFLIYYSTEARSYSLMIALVAGAALALVIAVDGDRMGAWFAYAALSAAAMYSHYTAAFPLAGQLAWAWLYHPGARLRLAGANVGALALFAPWIPGYLADQSSPTTAILSALQPFNPGQVARDLEAWSIGYPYVTLRGVPTVPGVVAIVLGIGGAAVALLRGALSAGGVGLRRVRTAPPGVVLVVVLALATPVGEAVYSLFGTNVLGARNLNASWPGLALLAGAALAAVRPARLAAALATVTLAGLAIGTVRTLQPTFSRPDYPAVASFIDDRAGPRDVVVDGAPFTPVPLTGLDVYLRPGRPEVRLGLPRSTEPFTLGDEPPPAERLIRRAFALSHGARIFLVRPLPGHYLARAETLKPTTTGLADKLLAELPPGYRIEQRADFQGLGPMEVDVIAGPDAPAG